jgi:predicted CopG family antitoxin
MEKTEITTIQISKETREKLADMGKKGETYDDIIKKLIETATKCLKVES